MPVVQKTKDFYFAIAHKNGIILSCIPEELKSNKIRQIAVLKNAEALKYVSNHLKMENLLAIVTENGMALEGVERKKKNRNNICINSQSKP